MKEWMNGGLEGWMVGWLEGWRIKRDIIGETV